ncbi:MAG: cell wall-binding repeat-containing protein, partial [Acidimicrobiales bacterium]
MTTGICSATDDGVTVTGSPGPGALTVSGYSSDPAGAPSFTSTGEYFDVEVASGSAFSSVTVKDCNLAGGMVLHWWNPASSTWETVSPVSGPSGTPACLTATLSSTSTPTIAELTGTVFAIGTKAPPPAPAVTRVAGSTADATAAAEFTRTFPFTKGTCPTTRDAVLATTKEYNDALSSQFLAQSLATGTLLTPTTHLATVTAATLEKEGIKTVYVVGGPLAITTTVVKA